MGASPWKARDQEGAQPRKGLTKRSRTLQAFVGPFGAGHFTFAFSVGSL
jgi:hypothetical protein